MGTNFQKSTRSEKCWKLGMAIWHLRLNCQYSKPLTYGCKNNSRFISSGLSWLCGTILGGVEAKRGYFLGGVEIKSLVSHSYVIPFVYAVIIHIEWQIFLFFFAFEKLLREYLSAISLAILCCNFVLSREECCSNNLKICFLFEMDQVWALQLNFFLLPFL